MKLETIITKELIKKLIDLSGKEGMNNRELAIRLEIKYSQLMAVKKILKDSGVVVPPLYKGRRKKNWPKFVNGILNDNETNL